MPEESTHDQFMSLSHASLSNLVSLLIRLQRVIPLLIAASPAGLIWGMWVIGRLHYTVLSSNPPVRARFV